MPTAGGVATITGTNFGADPQQMSVLVNGISCIGLNLTTLHFVATCNVSAGTGAGLLVNVTVAGQTIAWQNFAYMGMAYFSPS